MNSFAEQSQSALTLPGLLGRIDQAMRWGRLDGMLGTPCMCFARDSLHTSLPGK